MSELDEIKKLFEDDKYATEISGAEIIDAHKGYARCEMPVKQIHKNAGGMIMGGAIYTLADFAFAVAANSFQPATITLDSNITFLTPCKGSRLIAIAECEKDGRTTVCINVTITDDLGNKVALVRSTGFRVSKEGLGTYAKGKQ